MSRLQLSASTLAVALVAGAAATGAIDASIVDVLVLLGVAVVLPLAVPGRWWWALAATAAAVSLTRPVGGTAGLLVAPWFAAGAVAVAATWRQTSADPWDLRRLAALAAAGYSLVAASAFLASRLGLKLFGIDEPIVELTAIHYTYAGCAALVLAAHFLDGPPSRRRSVAVVGTVLTGAAPLLVATGFTTGAGIPQVGGAVLMTIGVWLTVSLELSTSLDRSQAAPRRVLLVVSGLAIWIPMVLAVAWAAGQHWDVPALSIPDMERTHGVVNSLAFVLCGLLAWHRPSAAESGHLLDVDEDTVVS